jgi:hypothetical protein
MTDEKTMNASFSCSQMVEQIDATTNQVVRVHQSFAAAGASIGTTPVMISRIVEGDVASYHGWMFRRVVPAAAAAAPTTAITTTIQPSQVSLERIPIDAAATGQVVTAAMASRDAHVIAQQNVVIEQLTSELKAARATVRRVQTNLDDERSRANDHNEHRNEAFQFMAGELLHQLDLEEDAIQSSETDREHFKVASAMMERNLAHCREELLSAQRLLHEREKEILYLKQALVPPQHQGADQET